MTRIRTRRLQLRPLTSRDFGQYREVRLVNRDWLAEWEPRPAAGAVNPADDAGAFGTRCTARDRERQLGNGYAFGVFHDDRFCGEVNVNNVVRGAFRNGHVGYWIDQRSAGRGIIPEALVGVFGFAFDQIDLHRLEINIIPRNARSLRVVGKLGLRQEGVAQRLIEIDGVWEDHARFAITAEEWAERRDEMLGLVDGVAR